MGEEDRTGDENAATSDDKGLRGRVTRHGEEAIGKVTQGMLDNPVVNRALSAAFETRQRATRAQEMAMGALNRLPRVIWSASPGGCATSRSGSRRSRTAWT